MAPVEPLTLLLDVLVKNALSAADSLNQATNQTSESDTDVAPAMGRTVGRTTRSPAPAEVPTVPKDPTATTYSYVEDSVLIMSLDSEDAQENILSLYRNNSKVISDFPGYMGPPYTPLTAPELDLVNVVRGHNLTTGGHVLYLYSSRTNELAWLIPAIFIGTCIFFLIVYTSFYGVKTLEVRVMMCYLAIRGCCRRHRGQSSSEESDALTSNMAHANMEMSGMSRCCLDVVYVLSRCCPDVVNMS